ncbi:MAG TPA: phage terminase large subunit, partial [Nitrospira sp.]
MQQTHIDISLQPKQEELGRLIHAEGSDVATWIGFGGARGGAKSGAARRLMVERRFSKPGTAGFIIRRNFKDLEENHLEKFREEFPALQQYYESGKKQYRLPNGSRIAFKFADTPDDSRQLARGTEAMDIFVDQAEQFSEQELLWLHTPNRWKGSGPGECKTVLFFNPGGIGTDFLRRIFHLRQYQGDEQPGDYAFIQSYGWDNYQWFSALGISEARFYALTDAERFQLFITGTDYGKKLNALPQAMRIGELMGSFSHFAGQYFSGVWDEEKCVLDSATARAIVQPWWTTWMSQDWGFDDHAAHLWFTSGRLSPADCRKYLEITTDLPLEIVIVTRELVARQMAEKDLAVKIREMTPEYERPARFFLSPDACAKKSAHTVAEEMSEVLTRHGLPAAEPADWERVAGWRFLYNGFRQSSSLRAGQADKERAQQGPLLFVSADCPGLISSIP